ncbi:MAG: hypothetical protein HY978_03305 [Candidatus Liptonbacteria bacterium]|nr:hypothetical protein [Candidatus Liptonbacteria bacterium]
MKKQAINPNKIWSEWRNIPCWIQFLHHLYPESVVREVEAIEDGFLELAQAEEQRWLEQIAADMPRSEQEWLRAFPEAREVIPSKIQEWRQEERKWMVVLRGELKRAETLQGNAQILAREIARMFTAPKVVEAQRHIRRLKWLTANPRTRGGGVSRPDIEAAKSVPVEQVFNMPLRQSGKTLMGFCPFHPERRPSFCIYPKTNSFYCFSCQRGGGVIRLVQLLRSCGFIEAVKYLLNR